LNLLSLCLVFTAVSGAPEEKLRIDAAALIEPVVLEEADDLDVGVVALAADPAAEPAALALQKQLRETLAAEPDVAATRVFRSRSTVTGKPAADLVRLATQGGCNAVVVASIAADGAVDLETFDRAGKSVKRVSAPQMPVVFSAQHSERTVRQDFEARALTPYVLVLTDSSRSETTYPMILDHTGRLLDIDEEDALPKRPEAADAFASYWRWHAIGRVLAVAAMVIGLGSWVIPFFGPLLAIPFFIPVLAGLALTSFMTPDLGPHAVTMANDHNMALARELGLEPAELPPRYFPLGVEQR